LLLDKVPADHDITRAPDARRTKLTRGPLRRLSIVLLLLASFTAADPVRAQSAQIILGPGLEDVMVDRDLLRAIFTMRLRAWPEGPPIRVFVLPDSDPLSDRFYREQLGMYSYMLRAAWDRMVFTGTGFAPTIVRSEEEMRERVSRTPGAIGYVSKGGASFLYRSPARIASAEVPLK
jgi:hypothetical protein